MRNLLLGVLIALTTTANAQKLYKTFTNSLMPTKTLDVQVSEEIYWLDVVPFEGSGTIGIAIKTYEMKRFNEMLANAKMKYIEWSDVAAANNVDEMSKFIKCPMVCEFKGFFKYGSKWKFAPNTTIKYKMTIKNGVETLYLFVGKMVASDNRYMENEGGGLEFTSVEEIEKFQKLLNEEGLKAFKETLKEKEEKTEDLFKD